MTPRNDPRDQETLDDLLQGRLSIYQKARGFRYSIDALLLANFAGESVRGRKKRSIKALDLGSGTGVIPLVLSCYDEIDRITGLEILEPLVEMSRRSVALNRLEDRITIIQGDIRNLPAELKAAGYDLIVANPPYRRKGRGRLNPDRQKAIARHEVAVNLKDIIGALSKLLKPRGRACFIYGAFRMTDLLAGLRSAGIEPARLRLIHSRVGEQAKMTLIEARRGRPSEMKVDPPLIVYRDKNNYSDEVLSIFKGP